MKTTIEISDALLHGARRLAARQGVTLGALIESGLQRVVAEQSDITPFKLRRASFKGEGLQAEFHDASWKRLQEVVYEDRGA